MNDFLLSFVEVKANLLYIREDELKPEFQSKLCLFSKSIEPLFIIIQLKITPLGFEPMISDLKDIRMDKAKKKINNWIQICFAHHENLVVKVIDDIPRVNSLYIDFTGINKLSVYRSKNDVDQILPFVKSQFSQEQLSLLHFS